MTPTTGPGSLSERYVWAVVRHLHADQRDEVAAELESAIADMAEATDERTALEQLGDPAVLAANYRGGRQALIGPGVYPDYVRLLRVLLSVVVPLLAVLAAFGAAIDDGATVGRVVTAALGAAVTAAVQVSFWVTVVFVLIDRYGPDTLHPDAGDWTPDDLPELPTPRHVGLGDTIGECAGTLLLVVALLVQRWWSPVRTADGEAVPILDPDLWNGVMWVVIVLLLVTAGLVVAAHVRGAWSWPLALATAAADLALFVVIAVTAARDELVNPAFLAELSADLDLDRVLQPNAGLIVFVVGLVLAWDAAEALRAAARQHDRPAPQVVGGA